MNKLLTLLFAAAGTVAAGCSAQPSSQEATLMPPPPSAAASAPPMSLGDIEDALRRIDRVWQLEYQQSDDLFRYRVVDAGSTTVLLAVRQTFLDLGMPVQQLSAEKGVVIAENNAPTPLSIEEWREVARVENPRLTKLVGPAFGLSDDPKGYVVTVKATVRNFKGKTLIILDYALDAPKLRRAGIQPSKYAAPLAVQLASVKFWSHLERRLREVKAPPPRKRTKQEMDA
jgi:hypothetical protein